MSQRKSRELSSSILVGNCDPILPALPLPFFIYETKKGKEKSRPELSSTGVGVKIVRSHPMPVNAYFFAAFFKFKMI